jgi:ribonuclease HIII
MDESGKGDLFGPLVTACVIAGYDIVRQWIRDGIKDSKSVSSDKMIFVLESKILKSDCVTNIVYFVMENIMNWMRNLGKIWTFYLDGCIHVLCKMLCRNDMSHRVCLINCPNDQLGKT